MLLVLWRVYLLREFPYQWDRNGMLAFAMMRVRNESRTYERRLVFVNELAMLLCLSGTLIDLFSKV
ncbi:MAG: hypothetical protein Q4F18_10135 [Clostridia bacterium]|nr:hypothetical protein [Clostridia bacterium]